MNDVTPDTKDWTWVLQRPCPDCGFVAAEVQPAQVAGLIEQLTQPWPQVLQSTDARERRTPGIWSDLEYGCHVRDVCRLFQDRTQLMLEQDEPPFANWDQDSTAVQERYSEQDPATVAGEITSSAASYARIYPTLTEPQWQRTGIRSNGSAFTVLTLAQYGLHDLAHHLHDVHAAPPVA